MLLDYLSFKLRLNEQFLLDIAKTASRRYKSYTIPKKNGNDRKIYHPSKELKVIQRVIHEDVLSKLPIHDAAYAYRKGINLADHAKFHCSAKYILRMDFKNFFESITSSDIERLLNKSSQYIHEKWDLADTTLLINYVCRFNKLTIGSITSPILSNVICYELDNEINKFCFNNGVKYTRYSDDIYFSTNEPRVLGMVEREIKNIIINSSILKSISLNRKKTYHSSKKKRLSVTGITITTKNSISIGREKKRYIRSLIFKWDTLNDVEKKYLTGYLSYCKMIEPEFINALCNKYGAEIIHDIKTYK